jgi:hypothetical protein
MEEGIDYDSTFSPCARLSTIRLLHTIATSKGLSVKHMDCPNAYLNGKCTKPVLVRLPKFWNEVNGGVLGRDGDPVLLVNSLYGTPDAGRNWNHVIHKYLTSIGFERMLKEPCMYKRKEVGNDYTYIALWVDDIFYFSTNIKYEELLQQQMKDRFDAKDLGKTSFALGLEFKWKHDGCYISQSQYIDKIQNRFPLDRYYKTYTPIMINQTFHKETGGDIDTMFPYRKVIGSLLYLAINTRPDIMFAVNTLARFSNEPRKDKVEALKHLLRYVVTTKDVVFMIPFKNSIAVKGWADASCADDADEGRSTIRHMVTVNDVPITWYSKMSKLHPDNTMESELIAAYKCAQELLWIHDLLEFLEIKCETPILHCDNSAANQFVYKIGSTQRTRHLRPKYFSLQDWNHKYFTMIHVASEVQYADHLTKAIRRNQLDIVYKRFSMKG